MNTTGPANGNTDSPARKADPCVMVIFGASGDLTKRKLIPALLNLASAKLLPEQFAIIGFASNDFTTETFRSQLSEDIKQFASCPVTPEMWSWFLKRIYYVRGDFQDAEAYKALKGQIADGGERPTTYRAIIFITWRLRRGFLAKWCGNWARPVWRRRATAAGPGSLSRSRLGAIWIQPRP